MNVFQIEGFLPNAVEAEERILDQHYNDKVTEHLEAVNNGFVKTINDEIEEVAINTYGGTTRDDLKKATPLNEEDAKLIAQDMRDRLTDLQERAAEFGLTKPQVTDMFLKQAGLLAKTYGLESLMDFAELPDKHGIAPSDNATRGEVAYQAKAAAFNRRQQLDKNRNAALADAKKEFYVGQVNALNMEVVTLDVHKPEDLERVHEIWDWLATEEARKNIPPAQHKALTSSLDDLTKGILAPKNSNPEVFYELHYKALGGGLDITELTNARRHLNKEDRQMLMKLIHDQSVGRDPNNPMSQTKFFSSTESNLKILINPPTKVNPYGAPKNQAVWTEARKELYRMWLDAQQKQGGVVTLVQAQAIEKYIYDKYIKYVTGRAKGENVLERIEKDREDRKAAEKENAEAGEDTKAEKKKNIPSPFAAPGGK